MNQQRQQSWIQPLQRSYSLKSRSCKYDELVDHEEFFHKSGCQRQPSTCYCEDVSWIWAIKPVQVKPIHGGKWLLFPGKQNVDEIWEKVKILVAANRLGNGAKVSKGEEANEFVICIYTTDFEDVKDVFRVLVTIRRNYLDKNSDNNFEMIHYKTDKASQEGVYKNDFAAQRAGYLSNTKLEPGQQISMYSSRRPRVQTGSTEIIKLVLNNIGPEFKRGLVAELRKEPHDIEAKIIFYDPPRIF